MKLSEFIFHIVCEMNDSRFAFPVKVKEEKERLSHCLSCDHYDETTQTCGLCNCYVPNKVKHLYEFCPLGQWDRSIDSWNETYCQIFANQVLEKYPESEEWKNQLN